MNGRRQDVDVDADTPLLWVLRDSLNLTGTKYGCGVAPAAGHPLQQAWIAEQVPQCGYGQSGMLMTAASLLKSTPKPTDADIDAALGRHICRCGTYQRIRQAIHRAAGSDAEGNRSRPRGARSWSLAARRVPPPWSSASACGPSSPVAASAPPPRSTR